MPHAAFEVKDLAAAIVGNDVLIEPNSPTEGLTVDFVVDRGAPVESVQFDRPESEVRPKRSDA